MTTSSGVQSVVTVWDYDKEGRLEFVIDPENNRTDYDYDANGNQVSVTDSRGYETQSVYDEKNRVVETIFPDDTPGDLSDNPRTIEGNPVPRWDFYEDRL